MILLIIGFIGILTGCVINGYGAIRAKKSSYTDLDAIIWCFVGVGIVNITTIIISFLLD